MDWISTIVVTLVIGAGAAIFYSALKEPMDLMFHYIKLGLIWVKEQFQNLGDQGSSYKEVISYG